MFNIANSDQGKLLLENRNFFFLWIGTFFTNMAERMFLVIVPIWLYESTNNPKIVALGTITETVAIIIFGFIGGVFVDRSSKKLLLWISNLICFICSVPIILSQGTFTSIWFMIFLIFTLASFSRLLGTTRAVLVNFTCKKDELIIGNTLMGFLFSATIMLAPIIVSFCISISSYKLVLILTCICYLISFIISFSIKVEELDIPQKKRNIVAEFTEGLSTIKTDSRLWGNILFMSFFMMGGSIFASLTYIYTKDILHTSTSVYTLSITLQGLGSIVGNFFIGPISKKYRSNYVIGYSIFAMFILEIAYIMPSSAIIMLIVSPLIGIFQQVALINAGTTFQMHCPPEKLGRVVGLRQTLVSLLSILTTGISASLLDYVNIQSIFYTACIFLLLCSFCGFLFLDHRSISKNKLPAKSKIN